MSSIPPLTRYVIALCLCVLVLFGMWLSYWRNLKSLRRLIAAEYSDEWRQVFYKYSLNADPMRADAANSLEGVVTGWPLWNLNIEDERYKKLVLRLRIYHVLCVLLIAVVVVAAALALQAATAAN